MVYIVTEHGKPKKVSSIRVVVRDLWYSNRWLYLLQSTDKRSSVRWYICVHSKTFLLYAEDAWWFSTDEQLPWMFDFSFFNEFHSPCWRRTWQRRHRKLTWRVANSLRIVRYYVRTLYSLQSIFEIYARSRWRYARISLRWRQPWRPSSQRRRLHCANRIWRRVARRCVIYSCFSCVLISEMAAAVVVAAASSASPQSPSLYHFHTSCMPIRW